LRRSHPHFSTHRSHTQLCASTSAIAVNIALAHRPIAIAMSTCCASHRCWPHTPIDITTHHTNVDLCDLCDHCATHCSTYCSTHRTNTHSPITTAQITRLSSLTRCATRYDNLPDRFPHRGDGCLSLLRGLFVYDPRRRLSASEARLHPYVVCSIPYSWPFLLPKSDPNINQRS
jgi:serine/threonine protein kinase